MRLVPFLILIPWGLGACEPGDEDPTDELPPEAWGPVSEEPAMPGATLLTEDELEELSQEYDVFEVPPPDPEAEAEAARAEMEADESSVQAWLTDMGVEEAPLNRLLDEPPELGGPDVELLDGNYEIELTEPRGKRVVTLGRPSLLRGLRTTLEKLDDPDNGADAFRLLYEQFPSAIDNLPIPTPEVVDEFDTVDRIAAPYLLEAWEGRLLALIDPGGVPPANRPTACGNEVEAFENWDRRLGNADSESHSDEGIYANFQWPQKWYATCVKDQAGRGTCGSFGITAALETGVALKFDRWVNLSEQDLYFHVRGKWNPVSYGDGIAVHPEWQHMLDNNYLLPFESQWPYNRSDVRIENDAAGVYSQSCNGYQWYDPPAGLVPNYCSDTVHQGGPYCVNLVFFQACGFVSAVSTSNTSGYRAGSEVEVWSPTQPASSMAVVRLALAAKLPTVLWAPVTPSFDQVSADGFVTYVGSGEGNRGSHIYQITGFVSNGDLEQQLPEAPPGAGGGYIIAKNSWGDAWADAGYAYLPYSWVEDYAISVTVLTSVQ